MPPIPINHVTPNTQGRLSTPPQSEIPEVLNTGVESVTSTQIDIKHEILSTTNVIEKFVMPGGKLTMSSAGSAY